MLFKKILDMAGFNPNDNHAGPCVVSEDRVNCKIDIIVQLQAEAEPT